MNLLTMGSSCSMHQRYQQYEHPFRDQRTRRRYRKQNRCTISSSRGASRSVHMRERLGQPDTSHSSLRHSVISSIPDRSIASLYPTDDNFITVSSYRRSPKSLADLACDAVCRSLPDMQGELPPGLPQDVVDDIFNSLIEHSALNATTLHALKNCELFSLPLTNCRGVTDEWLMPLSVRSSTCNSSATSINGSLSPIPYPTTPPQATMMRRGAILLPTDNMSSMDFDDSNDQNATFFATLDAQDDAESDHTVEDSSFSTSSFVSASSNYETMNSLLTSDVDDPTAMKCGLHRQHHITNLNSVETHLTNDSIMESLSDDIPEKDEERRPSMDETEVSDDLTIKMRACDSPLQQPYTPIAPEGYSLPSSFPGSIGSFEPQISFARNVKLLDLRGCQHLSDRGLLQLTDLSKLEVARFDNCHSITGRGLSALSNSRQLHTLSLVNCRRLTDEGIIHISRFLLTLECLILDGCRCITDRSMDAMSALSNLKNLDLSQCDLITDDGLKRLELLRELQVLSLGWCRKVTNEGLNTFTSHQERSMKMRVLRLSRCSSITDVGIAYVSRLSCLEELDLNGCTSVSSNALGNALQKLNHLHTLDVSYCPGIMRSNWQGKINSLKKLNLRYSSVKDIHLSQFLNLATLQQLSLDSCPVGDNAIVHLADNNVAPNLLSLDLADTNLTDHGMSKIAKFTKLTRLSLFYCNITNNSLRHIAKLTNLETLNLDSRDLSDEGLRHLCGLKKLRALDVFSGRVTDSGCSYISNITSLESLELCGGGVSDFGCSLLASLENLTNLNLSQNDLITNRGAAALAILTNLKSLNLSHTNVNASGLRFFSGLRNLQSLSLYGCRGVEEDQENVISNLKNTLPNLKCLRSQPETEFDGMVVVCDDDDDADSVDVDGISVDQSDIAWGSLAPATKNDTEMMLGDEEANEFSNHD